MRVYEAYMYMYMHPFYACAIEPRILVTCESIRQENRRSRKAGHQTLVARCTSFLYRVVSITCHSMMGSSLLDSHMYMYSYDRPHCLPEHSMSILTRNGGLRVGVGVINTVATT